MVKTFCWAPDRPFQNLELATRVIIFGYSARLPVAVAGRGFVSSPVANSESAAVIDPSCTPAVKSSNDGSTAFAPRVVKSVATSGDDT